jgi:hypothetical protein
MQDKDWSTSRSTRKRVKELMLQGEAVSMLMA